MKKKVFGLLLAVSCVMLTMPVFAATPKEDGELHLTNSIVITDSDELEKIIEEENIEIPDGEHLEKVEIDTYALDDNELF